MDRTLKVCFFGLGSIGTRHCRNLAEICRGLGIQTKIHAVRSSNHPLRPELAELGIKVFHKWQEMDTCYDMIFITNPTSLHYETMMQIGDRSKYFFIEKPVFEKGNEDTCFLPLSADSVCYVAAPLRYTGVIRAACEYVRDNEIYSARVISSSYLPDWRPGQDYRETYSARKDLGGGVSIDLIHEWDYLSLLFGMPDEVQSIIGRYSNLEIDSDDLAIYIARYPTLAVEVHLDYFGRKTRRELELYTEDGCTCFDIAHACVTEPDGKRTEYSEMPNEKYMREMHYFLSLVLNQERESNNSIEHACKVLRIAKGDRV